MSSPKTYQDIVDGWHNKQYANETQWRWQDEQQVEDLARELVAQQLREHKYLDVRPTAEEVAAIEAAHKLAGTKPDWAAILKDTAERADRACRKDYYEVAERVKKAALAEGY